MPNIGLIRRLGFNQSFSDIFWALQSDMNLICPFGNFFLKYDNWEILHGIFKYTHIHLQWIDSYVKLSWTVWFVSPNQLKKQNFSIEKE